MVFDRTCLMMISVECTTKFLAMPIAWKGSLAQYAGRIHRESDGKDRVTIYDYVDCSLPMLQRMFKKTGKKL